MDNTFLLLNNLVGAGAGTIYSLGLLKTIKPRNDGRKVVYKSFSVMDV